MHSETHTYVRSNIKSTVQTKAGTSCSKLAEFAGNSDNVSRKVTGAEASTFLPSRNPLRMSLRVSLSSKEICPAASTAFPIKGRFQPRGMLIPFSFAPFVSSGVTREPKEICQLICSFQTSALPGFSVPFVTRTFKYLPPSLRVI